MIDPDRRLARLARETKAVMALDRKKWRHVENLLRLQPIVSTYRPPVFVKTQIAMAFAERVADSRNDCTQGIFRTVTEPETDRIEGIAQNARHGDQLDIMDGRAQSKIVERPAHP